MAVPRLRPPVASKVLSFFDEAEKRVWLRTELRVVLERNRIAWDAPLSLTASGLISFLEARGKLREIEVKATDGTAYAPFKRFVWGEASPFQVALSLRPGAYCSHGTAVFLHGLTEQIPTTLYVNKEQSDKGVRRGEVELSQAAVHRAFSNAPRVSRYVFKYGDYRIVVISGKHTEHLEVTTLRVPTGEPVEATKLERTLIDIAVRPAYAGGVFQVLDAYRAARERVSVATLIATLKKLGHAYPYHQAIGFYMERAGYDPAQLNKLKALGCDIDFYLMNQMKEPRYSSEWRLFFPEGM